MVLVFLGTLDQVNIGVWVILLLLGQERFLS